MKCFDVVRTVLEQTYAEIPGDEDARDESIRTRLSANTQQYRHMLMTAGGPDFGDAATRFAYVFAYVPAHSHWVYELIEWSPEAQAIFQQERMRVACIGGGPGSDLVGILKYIDRHNVDPSVFCEIYDGCIDWRSTWSDLAFSLDWKSPLHTDYIIQDVADRGAMSVPCKLAKADLITLNFFLSEIYHLDAAARSYIQGTLRMVRSGGVILMNDNKGSSISDWFDEVAAAEGFEILLASEGTRKIYDGSEQKTAVGRFADKFNRQPKMTGELCWRVARKR